MSFLELNRIALPILNATPRREMSRKGERKRVFGGEVHDRSRGSRRSWRMTACFTEIEHGYADAEAAINLINGLGHYVSFATGLQASTGLNPLPTHTGFDVNVSATNGFAGLPGFLDGITTSFALDYDAQLPDGDWTIMWRDQLGVDEFETSGFAANSAGVEYKNGVTPASSNAQYSVRNGVVLLRDDSLAGEAFDELVMLPYAATDAMLETWSSGGGGDPIWGPLPILRATGSFVAESHVYVLGRVTRERYVQKSQRLDGNVNSAWVNNAMIVEFELEEVSQAYVRAELL